MVVFAKYLTQRDECKLLTVKPMHLTLDLSNCEVNFTESDKAKETEWIFRPVVCAEFLHLMSYRWLNYLRNNVVPL